MNHGDVGRNRRGRRRLPGGKDLEELSDRKRHERGHQREVTKEKRRRSRHRRRIRRRPRRRRQRRGDRGGRYSLVHHP